MIVKRSEWIGSQAKSHPNDNHIAKVLPKWALISSLGFTRYDETA